jgi:hypothetical protein
MCLEWPKNFINRWFDKQNGIFWGRVNYAQEMMLHQKYMKTSSATNKTISDAKFERIVWSTSGA